MCQHLVLILQLHAKHRVRQRLDHGRHHFDGVFLPARIARLLHLLCWPSLHALPGTTVSNFDYPISHYPLDASGIHQTGPAASFGRVKIHGPFFVTATVCSKCAESLPSVVTAVQSSASTRTPGPPVFTIGSIARTIPSCSFGP